MAWDCRIRYTKRLRSRFPKYWSNTVNTSFLLILLLSLASGLSIVNSFEFTCDESPRPNCSCESGQDGRGNNVWEIKCPAAMLEVYPITLKVTPLTETTARLDVACNDPKVSEIAIDLIQGVNFGKDSDTFNVTEVVFSYCQASSPGRPTVLKDFLNHVNLSLENIVKFVFKPSSRAPVRRFPQDFISSFKNLEILDLTQLNLTSVPDLSQLSSLKELFLRENSITGFSTETFAANKKLVRIDLNLNKLPEIGPAAFPSSLRELNLAKNNITSITKASLSNLAELRYLELTWNPLTSLEPGAFSNLSHLLTLHIDSSKFTEFPKLENLPNLEEISISYRNAESLARTSVQAGVRTRKRPIPTSIPKTTVSPPDFPVLHGQVSNIPNLKILVYSHDGLTTFPILQKLPNLTSLKLNGNKIRVVPEKAFAEVPLLKFLDLNSNEIEVLNHLDAPGLESLDLSNNQLRSIDSAAFSALKNLTSLKMRNNRLQYVDPRAFVSQRDLTELDLSGNLLTFEVVRPGQVEEDKNTDILLEYVFDDHTPLRHCTRLKTLDLSYNYIQSIFGDWKLFFSYITKLDLSHNSIKRLDATDLSLSARDLQLNLSFNNISSVSMDYADFLIDGHESRLLTVIMDGNPLNCDCEILAFKNFKLKGITFEYNDLTCKEPQRLANVQFAALRSTDLMCPLDESTGCPFICECWKVPANNTIVVDCSFRNLTDPFTSVHAIRGKWTEGYNYSLNLAGNRISDLNLNHTGRITPKISKIDLSENELTSLAFLRSISNNNDTLFSLALNKFSCNDCEFHKTLRSYFKRVEDYNNVTCLFEEESEDLDGARRLTRYLVREFPEDQVCSQQILAAEVQGLIIGFSIMLMFMVVFIAVYFRYGWALRAYMYSKGLGCCFSNDDADEDGTKIYDAFVSYSHKDEDWVLTQLVTRLEEQEGFKLCLHFRDWTPGDWIPDQIVRSVDKSRRTVVILSKHFVESVWSRLEFKAAHSQALSEKANRLILIVMDDELKDQDIKDDDLRVYMKMNTYLKYGDPWFWHKLKYALPHKKSVSVEQNYLKQQQRERAIQLDKLRAKMENTIA